MSITTKVLIVEQEPLITHSIEEALNHIIKTQNQSTYRPKSVYDYELASNEIECTKHLDLVFLNIDMTSSKSEKLNVFKDMVQMLRYNSPTSKLFTLTSRRDNYMIFDVFKTLNPESIILKSDISFKGLVKAIDTVMNNIPFYSKSILKLMRSRMVCDISLDKRDRLILYHLSKGVKTKDLPKLVHLSNSGVESRKRNLKTLFNVERKSDRFLLEQARLKGFI